MNLTEEWRPVVGFEGRYEVSNLGRVRSLDWIQTITNRWGTQTCARRKGRLLRPGVSSSGYPTVAIGRGNTRTVHSLVAEAFLGPCPHGMEVLHADDDRTNPALSNLSYGTRRQNIHQMTMNCRRANWRSPDLIREVRRLLAEGHSQREVARRTGVHYMAVNRIASGRNYAHVA